MKILLVTSMVPDAEGAGAIPVLLHAQLVGLAERNEVVLVTAMGDEPGEAGAAARLEAGPVEAHVIDRRQPASAMGRWRRRFRLAGSWAFGRRPWRSVWFADPGVQAAVDRLRKAREFDVAVVEDSAMGLLRLPPGLPSVLTEHEVLRPRSLNLSFGRPGEWPARALHEIDWRRRPRFQRRAWNRYQRLVVFTRRDAASIAELAPEVAARVRVSPFGLILPRAADPAAAETGLLLFVGNFFHQPNRDSAIWLAREILPRIVAEHPEARLRIVGTEPTAEILALAGPNVEVVADAPSVRPHLEAAAVVMAPVRTGGGMRMKVLQALAEGKAVVTTTRGVEGFDAFDEAPPLVVADEAPEIAAATAALLADGGRQRQLGEDGRAFAQRHYSPSAWAERLEELYREAIADG